MLNIKNLGPAKAAAHLRIECLIIGYLNLVACIVDIVFQVLILAIVTSFFQCDIDSRNLQHINWPWLEPLLLYINMGTHGYYPLPPTFSNGRYTSIPREGKCYPGMLHLPGIDVVNFLINVIWSNFVWKFISALHWKNPEQLRKFAIQSLLKLAFQMYIVYLAYQPHFNEITSIPIEVYRKYNLINVCLALYFLVEICRYTQMLRKQLQAEVVDLPPSYVELDELSTTQRIHIQDEKKNETVPPNGPVTEQKSTEKATELVW